MAENLRNRDQYRDRAPDWSPLNACFGNSGIRPSDLDGMIERNGYFLFLESKPLDGVMFPKTGQRLALMRLDRMPGALVVVLRGWPGPEMKIFTFRQAEQMTMTLPQVQCYVRGWFTWASLGPPGPGMQKGVA